MKHRCPTCHKVIEASRPERSKRPAYFPFCSERCKLVDLGGWLDAEHKIITELHAQQGREQPEGLSEVREIKKGQ
ncbi:MAG: DNA gyrase inhibitor YacG [Phycisphaerales bacterium]|nr:MAG: DNA gyrase inhibitor YacG [Phycisphaerales bacterium]